MGVITLHTFLYQFCHNKNLQNDTIGNVKVETSSADILLKKQHEKTSESENKEGKYFFK